MISKDSYFIVMENGQSREHTDVEIEISNGSDDPLRWELRIENVRNHWTGEPLTPGPDYDALEVEQCMKDHFYKEFS